MERRHSREYSSSASHPCALADARIGDGDHSLMQSSIPLPSSFFEYYTIEKLNLQIKWD